MAARDEIVRIAHWWADPGEYAVSVQDLLNIFDDAGLDGALSAELAQKSIDGHATQASVRHWCGIFACCVLTRAGVSAKWSLGNGKMSGAGISYRPGTVGIAPGDVAIIPRYQHHFIITDIDAASNSLHSVDGNQGGQTIAERDKQIKYKGSQSNLNIYGYYKIK